MIWKWCRAIWQALMRRALRKFQRLRFQRLKFQYLRSAGIDTDSG